ncbi:MAG: hypothetical protein ABI621_01835 [Chloroflexota bacterium]
MTATEARIQRAIEELTGNEALLEMLEIDAAEEMLGWGSAMVASLMKQTEEMDDTAAELTMAPRLKAVRQSMRAVGNWAVGKYTDPESRVQLRDKLLQHFATIWENDAPLPAAEELDAVLNEVDDINNRPLPLILKLKTLFPESM